MLGLFRHGAWCESHRLYFTHMLARIVATLIFILVEGLIILAAIPTVLFLYLPYVALKGLVMTLTGKAKPKVLAEI